MDLIRLDELAHLRETNRGVDLILHHQFHLPSGELVADLVKIEAHAPQIFFSERCHNSGYRQGDSDLNGTPLAQSCIRDEEPDDQEQTGENPFLHGTPPCSLCRLAFSFSSTSKRTPQEGQRDSTST